MNPLEKSFHDAMMQIYTRARCELKYDAKQLFRLVNDKGGLQAAKELVVANNLSYGFEKLWEKGRLDLTVEAHVLLPEYRTLFDENEIKKSRDRLESVGYFDCSNPSNLNGDVAVLSGCTNEVLDVKIAETKEPESKTQPASNTTKDTLTAVNADETANITREIVAALKENTAVIKEHSQRQIVDSSHAAPSQKIVPNFEKEGNWYSAKEFSKRTGYSVKTLLSYCEPKKGAQWLNKKDPLGKNKAGHFFKRQGDKGNSPYVFFYYDLPEKNTHFLHPSIKKTLKTS